MAIGRAEFLDSGGEELGRLFPEKTARLKLHLKTRVDADAEAAGSAELAKALGVRVPESWPPVFVAPPTNEAGGWGTCYLIHTRAGEVPNLIGMAGAARWAPEKRTVQVGTSVVSEFYGQRIGKRWLARLPNGRFANLTSIRWCAMFLQTMLRRQSRWRGQAMSGLLRLRRWDI